MNQLFHQFQLTLISHIVTIFRPTFEGFGQTFSQIGAQPQQFLGRQTELLVRRLVLLAKSEH